MVRPEVEPGLHAAGSETGRRILVTARSRLFAEALRFLIEQEGCSSVAARQDNAIARFAGADIDTVVVDGDGDSGAVVEFVRSARRQFGEIDVVLLVAERGPAVETLAEKTAARITLTRDVDPSSFVRTVTSGGHGHEARVTRRSTVEGTADPLATLTHRQRTVLAQLLTGSSDSQMAARLGVSAHTVRAHLQRAFAKLGVHSRYEAAAIALRAGLRPPGRPHL